MLFRINIRIFHINGAGVAQSV